MINEKVLVKAYPAEAAQSASAVVPLSGFDESKIVVGDMSKAELDDTDIRFDGGKQDGQGGLSSDEKQQLIRLYKDTGNIEYRNRLVLECMDIVKFAASSFRAACTRFGDVNDIVNEGAVALINAIETFTPDKNAKFETYANLRVRGAIIDYIRRLDFIPRRVRKFAIDLDAAHTELYRELNRRPDNEELAAKMNMPLSVFMKNMSDSAGIMTVSFEELLYEDNFGTLASSSDTVADNDMFKREQTKVIADAIARLTPREQKVIALYYYERLKMSQIAEVIGVTESRVCQMHSKCMLFLKKALTDYFRPL